MRVGVEVGGTFTDLIGIGPDGLFIAKVPSVPSAPEQGAFNALLDARVDFSTLEDLVHGSTVATNAVLERKGARTAFVTTEGFRDLLFLQRHDRRSVYDLHYAKPLPTVLRSACFEARERLDATGQVLTPLDEDHFVGNVIPALAHGGFAAVAVCLLNAYANDDHEGRIARLIQHHCPDLLVACSSEVSREFREFERASTTSLSAYVQPVIDRYLDGFERTLDEHRFDGAFSIMQSNGGRLPASTARQNAITTLLSGPAAGVMGAVCQAKRSGMDSIITFDMGGTSTDVCLVDRGEPELANEFDIDGLPVRTPILDIVTVGAGGGSIIWRDDGGMLRVGPESAGASPGPACYGRGGVLPTITDAHVVRKVMRPETFLGGRMSLDVQASEAALAPLAEVFGKSVGEFAGSAIQVANANIVRAIQLVSTERGKDPRDYVLVPFGGAGPLHATQVAEELGMETVLVPPHAGVLSAFGLLAADYVHFETRTHRVAVDGSEDGAGPSVRQVFDELRQRVAARFTDAGFRREPELSLNLDMRFVGQAFEIPVPIEMGQLESLGSLELRTAFAAAHQKVFFHGIDSTRPIEIVGFRLRAALPSQEAPSLRTEELEPSEDGGPKEIQVYLGREHATCSLVSRLALRPGVPVSGPSIIVEPTTTTFVASGWSGELDESHNLILRREPRHGA